MNEIFNIFNILTIAQRFINEDKYEKNNKVHNKSNLFCLLLETLSVLKSIYIKFNPKKSIRFDGLIEENAKNYDQKNR